MRDARIAPGEVWYRVLTPRWADRPLSGDGAARAGGRFNRPGLPALYLSNDPMTAVEEYRQDMPVITPVTLAAYVAGPFDVVDLADGTPDADLEAPWSGWRGPWKLIARIQRQTPASWLCGDETLARRVPAIRFPSMRRTEGRNLVVFCDLVPQQTLAVYDPQGALPRDQSSWSQQ